MNDPKLHLGLAKQFLQDSMGLSEPEAHRTLQIFACNGNILKDDAAVILLRLSKAVSDAKVWVARKAGEVAEAAV